MSVGFLLTALDSVLETLFVFLSALKLHFARIFAVKAGVDNLLINLGPISLDLLVQVHSGLWCKE